MKHYETCTMKTPITCDWAGGPETDHYIHTEEPPQWIKGDDVDSKVQLCDSFQYDRVVPMAQECEDSGDPAYAGVPCAVETEAELHKMPWYNRVVCPAETKNNGGLPWIMTYRYEIETCTTTSSQWSTAFGIAFGYSGYVEMVSTVLCVLTLQACGIIIMTKKVSMSLLLREDDTFEMEQELCQLKAEIVAIQAATTRQPQPHTLTQVEPPAADIATVGRDDECNQTRTHAPTHIHTLTLTPPSLPPPLSHACVRMA